MKSWTTADEFLWLTERVPRWRKRKGGENKGFMKRTGDEFLEAFPTSKITRSKVNKVSIASIMLSHVDRP